MNSIPPPSANYDRIAHLYDVDMARNMAFDDVGFYRNLCLRVGGRVLELGCGNGRILLELLTAGIDAAGVDNSFGMLAALQRKARMREMSPRVARMDARCLGFGRAFDVLLYPYSLVTYMRCAEDMALLLAEARRVLRPGGLLVLDAFVPRSLSAASGFAIDYCRPYEAGTLTRSKRVVALAGGTTRIERRYEILGAAGATSPEIIETGEEIRPWTPDALLAVVAANGLLAERQWWDYDTASAGSVAQFFTVACRMPA